MLAALLVFTLTCLAWAQEPEPMSFDEVEQLEVLPSPAAAEANTARKARIVATEILFESEDFESPERYDLLLRLAHLKHEQARATRDREPLREAAEAYAQLLKDNPTHPQTDHVMFFLGFALQGLGEDGRSLLKLVGKKYPASSYVPHAMLHLGEAEFEQEQWQEAHTLYEGAAEHSFPFRDFALYKQAWTERKLGDTSAAIYSMGHVVSEGRPALGRVALRALTYWSDELGQAVDPHLLAIDAEQSCLNDLPDLRARIAAEPMHADAILLHHDIRTCLSERAPNHLRAEVSQMQSRYGKGSSWWKLQDGATRRLARTVLRDAQSSIP